MSDDKGPYELGDKLPMSDVSFTTLETEIKTAIANAAHAEGRKAERERCADIARQHFSCEGIAQDIEKKISGGQDGE